MSDEIATQDSMEPNIGTTEDVGMETQVSDMPYLETENYANHVVRVKLDGEELQVPLSEALAGYQRQADYTRKTQELAEQRNQMQYAATIQTALERDPEATIDLLARHYTLVVHRLPLLLPRLMIMNHLTLLNRKCVNWTSGLHLLKITNLNRKLSGKFRTFSSVTAILMFRL